MQAFKGYTEFLCLGEHIYICVYIFLFKFVLLVGNDSADEEDIGRNEPPVSRYPAAETEKDKTYKMDKHSSLGSSGK